MRETSRGWPAPPFDAVLCDLDGVLRRWRAMDDFDHAYGLPADRAGVPVSRCLFVDDSRTNTRAACALGMTAVHFQHPGQLRDALTPVLDSAR